MAFRFKIDEPVGTSNGFWYDLTDGGYIKPDEILANDKDVSAVNNAIRLLRNLEQDLIDANLLKEF